MTPQLVKSFWARVLIREPLACWFWNGRVNPRNRYGQISHRVAGKNCCSYAHRLAYEIAHGPIPKGMHVCHRCDVKLCVNPHHLFVGTMRDNMRDMVQKGRSQFGLRNTQAKFSEDVVRRVRALWALGKFTKLDLADYFGMSRQHVYQLVHDRRRTRVA